MSQRLARDFNHRLLTWHFMSYDIRFLLFYSYIIFVFILFHTRGSHLSAPSLYLNRYLTQILICRRIAHHKLIFSRNDAHGVCLSVP